MRWRPPAFPAAQIAAPRLRQRHVRRERQRYCVRHLRAREFHQAANAKHAAQHAVYRLIPAFGVDVDRVHEAAIDVVGERDRAEHRFAVCADVVGDGQYARRHVARMSAALAQVRVAQVEIAQHHAVREGRASADVRRLLPKFQLQACLRSVARSGAPSCSAARRMRRVRSRSCRSRAACTRARVSAGSAENSGRKAKSTSRSVVASMVRAGPNDGGSAGIVPAHTAANSHKRRRVSRGSMIRRSCTPRPCGTANRPAPAALRFPPVWRRGPARPPVPSDTTPPIRPRSASSPSWRTAMRNASNSAHYWRARRRRCRSIAHDDRAPRHRRTDDRSDGFGRVAHGALLLGRQPDHEAGHIDEMHDGKVKRLREIDEAADLARGVGRPRAAIVIRIARQQRNRPAVEARVALITGLPQRRPVSKNVPRSAISSMMPRIL